MKLGDHSPDLLGQWHAPYAENVHERAVVPEQVVPAGVEPRPELLAMLAIVGQDGASVVELVRGRDGERTLIRRGAEVVEIPFLPYPPGLLLGPTARLA